VLSVAGLSIAALTSCGAGEVNASTRTAPVTPPRPQRPPSRSPTACCWASRPPKQLALADLRRAGAQPAPGTFLSCIDWWTVDLFVDARGRVVAVTLDLYDP
jgi:hypothetical protein